MLTLNLLPDQYKNEYALEQKRRLVAHISIIMCLIAILFNVLLGSVYAFVFTYEQSLRQSIETQTTTDTVKRLSAIEKNVRELNTSIGALATADAEIIPLAPVLERIAALVGQDAYLKSISMDANTKTVSIAGFAKTRAAVLALAEALQKSDFVAEGSVKNPIKNILKEENIDFTFTFTFTHETKTSQ
ncbi:PilN domain-containing protein [Candidatus Azambacteria bacterium]|nr:PilN domain-containing protein [Candidatus Azambacteria bacterium]